MRFKFVVGNQIFDPALRFEITESTSGKFRGEAGRTSVYHSKVYDSYYSFRWRMKNHFRSHVQPQDPPRSPPLHAGSWLLQSRIWKCYFNFDDWWLSSVFGASKHMPRKCNHADILWRRTCFVFWERITPGHLQVPLFWYALWNS